MLARGLNTLYKGCAAAACVLLFLLFALVLTGIGARLLGVYSGGISDIAGYVMAGTTFLALAPTFRAGGHIYVSLVVSRLPPRARWRTSIAAHAFMVAAACALAAYMSRLAYFSYLYGERSEGADALPLWIPQLPAAFGACVLALAALHGLADTVRNKPR